MLVVRFITIRGFLNSLWNFTVTMTLVLFLLLSISIYTTSQSVSSKSRKCGTLDIQLESCIAYGYKVKWIKCAARHFAIEYLGYEEETEITSQNAHLVGQGADSNVGRDPAGIQTRITLGDNGKKSAHDIRNTVVKKKADTEKKKKKTKRSGELLRDVTYDRIENTLTLSEWRSCRSMERRIKKHCAAQTKYTCVTLQDALSERRRKLERAKDVLVGGTIHAEFHDPLIIEAIKRVIQEFKLRANKVMTPEQTIIIGEVDEVLMTGVQGRLYEVFIDIGITSDPSCKANEDNGLVTYKNCDDHDSLGKAEISVVYQDWMPVQWTWFEFTDMEGPPLKKKYWNN